MGPALLRDVFQEIGVGIGVGHNPTSQFRMAAGYGPQGLNRRVRCAGDGRRGLQRRRGNRGRCLSDALQCEGVQPFLCRRCAALLRVRL